MSWCIVLGALLLSERLVAALMEDAKTRMFARRLWIVCFGAVTVLFLLGIQLHTPLFPVYDPWVNAQRYFGPDAPENTQQRYGQSLPLLDWTAARGSIASLEQMPIYVRWNCFLRYHLEGLDCRPDAPLGLRGYYHHPYLLEQMRSDWNDGYRIRMTLPSRGAS